MRRVAAPKLFGSYRVVLLFCPHRHMPSFSKKKASSSKRGARQTAEPIVVEGLDEENAQQEMKVPTGLPDEPWHRSPSPSESWSDDDDWPMTIVGEEVDGWGNVRCVDEWPFKS